MTAVRPGAIAQTSAAGTNYTLLARTGPAEGMLAVYLGAHLLTTLDLYSPTTQHQVAFPIYTAHTAPNRTFTFKVTGKHAVGSTGARVYLDALVASNVPE